LQEVNLAVGEHKSPSFLANEQPFGQIPVLHDGDFRLYESRAIARYLASKHKSEKLYPSDLKKRALVEQWLSVNQSNSGPINDVVAEYFFKPFFTGQNGDASKADALKEKLNKFFDILETHLTSNKYFAGDEFTLADIVWLPYLQYMTTKCPGFETPFENHPHLKQWWTNVTGRDSWKKAISKGF
jgi:glutathione S-transferase